MDNNLDSGFGADPTTSSPQNSILDLHFDVLATIMDHTVTYPDNRTIPYRSDLSRLMMTCRYLYDIGVPILLQGEVCIHSEEFDRANSFCDFVLHDHKRAHYLKQLSIAHFHWNNLDQKILIRCKLAEIVSSTSQLTYLAIDGSESMLEEADSLRDAVASLHTLNSIQLYGVGPKSQRFLESLHSPISSACLIWVSWVPVQYGMNPLESLKFFTSSLTSVTLSSLPIGSRIHYSQDSISFPHVHTLTLAAYTDTLDMVSLYLYFPNLRHLHCFGSSGVTFHDSVIPATHTQLPNPTWTRLGSVKGDPTRVASMGLRCRADYWEAFTLYPHWVLQFQAVLRDIRPSYLQLRVDVEEYGLERIPGIFPDTPVLDVTHLEISWNLARAKCTIESFFNKTTACLEKLSPSLTFVMVILQHPRLDICESLSAYPEEFTIDQNGHLDTKQSTRKYAHRIASVLPQLAFICIAYWHEPRRNLYCKVRRVQDNGGGTHMEIQEIGDDAGLKYVTSTTPFVPK